MEAAKPATRSTVFLAPEIIIRAYEMGFRIKEVDIDYHPRIYGEATSGKPLVILRSVRDMLTFWIKHSLGKGRLASRRSDQGGTDFDLTTDSQPDLWRPLGVGEGPRPVASLVIFPPRSSVSNDIDHLRRPSR